MILTNNLVYNVFEEEEYTEINNELSALSFDFSSNDSVGDPNYVPLSEITNVASIASTSTDGNNDVCFLKQSWNVVWQLSLE